MTGKAVISDLGHYLEYESIMTKRVTGGEYQIISFMNRVLPETMALPLKNLFIRKFVFS